MPDGVGNLKAQDWAVILSLASAGAFACTVAYLVAQVFGYGVVTLISQFTFSDYVNDTVPVIALIVGF